MAKKIFVSLAIIFLSLCCGVCFAAENNTNVNLGDEITRSLDKAGDSVGNVVDDVMDAGENTVRGIGNTMNGDNRNNTNNNYMNNNATSQRNNNYTNGTNYNAVRTSVDENMATGTMSTTTWIWIILAVAAIVIVAMIWYYAVQDNNRD